MAKGARYSVSISLECARRADPRRQRSARWLGTSRCVRGLARRLRACKTSTAGPQARAPVEPAQWCAWLRGPRTVSAPKTSNNHPATLCRPRATVTRQSCALNKLAPKTAGAVPKPKHSIMAAACSCAAGESGEDQHRIDEAAGKPSPQHAEKYRAAEPGGGKAARQRCNPAPEASAESLEAGQRTPIEQHADRDRDQNEAGEDACGHRKTVEIEHLLQQTAAGADDGTGERIAREPSYLIRHRVHRCLPRRRRAARPHSERTG